MKAYLYPVFCLIVLKFIIMFRMVRFRFSEVKSGKVDHRYFKRYEGESNLSDQARYTDKNYDNLFQWPILFYATVAIMISLKFEDSVALGLSWAFVITRYIHSYIHVTKNRITPRLRFFGLGCLILFLLWVNLLIKV